MPSTANPPSFRTAAPPGDAAAAPEPAWAAPPVAAPSTVETTRVRRPAAVERVKSSMPMLRRLHFYAGIFVAPFIILVTLTGLAYVFTPQIERMVYADQLTVSPAGSPKPLAQQVAAAKAAHPTGFLSAVVPPAGRSDTTQVVFFMPELGDKQHTVYVDPYTNSVRGTLTTRYGTSPMSTWLGALHADLHLGVVGRYYSELAGSWMWILVVGGVIIWIARQAKGRKRIRRVLLPDLSTERGRPRRTRSWHSAVGVWLAIGLVLLPLTGLIWSRYSGARLEHLQQSTNAQTPVLTTKLSSTGASGGAPKAANPADVDAVVAVARRSGLHGPIQVGLPRGPGQGWTVTQTDDEWPVRYDRIAVDPVTSTVIARSDFADWPLLAQVSKLGVEFHLGSLFGLANQVLLAVLAIGTLAIVWWGYRLWWQRRPTRADRRAVFGRPPPRGTWRRMNVVAFLVWALIAGAIGWAFPVLGVSLLGFLALDLVIGMFRFPAAVRRRRAARQH